MSSRDHDRLTAIFLQAVDLDPEERAAFLDEACLDDLELRAEVESLLSHDADVPAIMRPGAVAAVASPEPVPDRVGPYRILYKLGEGGMGVVYRAEQERPIRRQAAVKLIKAGIESRQVITRFESERQALALMNHPNIARVFDAGTTEHGRPYFAMEYVEGEPITDYCDRHRLSLGQRLRLFTQVCDGVQHAHLNAIIHRDIKPSNVMVTLQDGSPLPKIIDFGVAKATNHRLAERSMSTEMGQLVGTPEYMSPEQAAMNGRNVDTRTDVYSLGVLLYELIVGAQPFDAKKLRSLGFDGIRRTIIEDEPLTPSTRFRELGDTSAAAAKKRRSDPVTLARRLCGDLDWITMKALEKEPGRRYPSPADLAADIERYLTHEPVLASPPGTLYRIRKFSRKHRAGMTFASALVIVLLGFAITGTIQASRIAQEAERASQEAATAARVSEFLVGLFDTSPRIGQRMDSTTPLDALTQGSEKVLSDPGLQPLLKARLLEVIGNMYRKIHAYEQARPLLESAHATLRELLGKEDPTTLECANTLARLYLALNLMDEAETLYAETLQIRGRVLGDQHPDTLRSMNNLAYLYKFWRRDEDAAVLFQRTVEGLRSVLGEDHPETMMATGFLAGVYLELGRYDEAEPLLLDLVASMPEVLGTDHFETKVASYNLGCAYANLGKREQALETLSGVFDAGFSIAGSILEDRHLAPLRDDPALEVLARRAWMNSPTNWSPINENAETFWRLGLADKAESLYLEVLDAATRVGAGCTNPDVTRARGRLTILYLSQERFNDAEALALDSLDSQRRELGGDHYNTIATQWLLAQSHLGRGERAEGIALLELSLSGIESNEGSGSIAYVQATRSALAGDREGTLRYLKLAADRGYPSAEDLDIDRTFASLYGDPEFEAIKDEIKARYRLP